MRKLEAVVHNDKKNHEGTLSVIVSRVFSHPKYRKKVKKIKKYIVCCNKEKKYSIGSKVFIIQCAPVSKLKRWKIIEGDQK